MEDQPARVHSPGFAPYSSLQPAIVDIFRIQFLHRLCIRQLPTEFIPHSAIGFIEQF